MPRITTSNAAPATVKALEKLAATHRRSPAKEALIAVEEHLLFNIINMPPKLNKPRKP